MNAGKHTCITAMALMLAACGDMFDYHPYDTRFGGQKNINAANILRIEAECLGKDTLTFAFISDTHGDYSDTEDAVDNINARPDISFVIHGGDLTDCGTTKEFTWQRKRLARLRMPYVALIGNHDFLGTGNETYQTMYGSTDFSFTAGNVKFVCLNTNATEYDYLAAVPNFDFMEAQIAHPGTADRTVACMHARPYSEQFNNNVAKAFQHYIQRLPGIMFCINGHDHCLQETDIYNDGIIYYGAPAIYRRSYLIFTITPTGYTHEVISF